MADVDCILMGAEGVVESGGIVNKIGSYTISLCAKELNKPGMNCMKISLPGKLILGERKCLLEVRFS